MCRRTGADRLRRRPGEKWRASWNSSVTSSPPAKIAPDIKKVVTLPTAKSRSANRCDGSIGSATERSQTTDATSRTPLAASVPRTSALSTSRPALARPSAQIEGDHPSGHEPDSDEIEALPGTVALGQHPTPRSTALSPSGR